MNELFGINVVDGGPIGLLALVFLFVITGRLVPRKNLEDLIAERDYWRAAHTEEVKARTAERELTNELLEVARAADQVLASLPRPASREEVTAGAPADDAAPPQA